MPPSYTQTVEEVTKRLFLRNKDNKTHFVPPLIELPLHGGYKVSIKKAALFLGKMVEHVLEHKESYDFLIQNRSIQAVRKDGSGRPCPITESFELLVKK